MKLPSAHLVIVAREKITDYLLNAAHPDNSGKAQFFASLGLAAAEWELVAQSFRKQAHAADVTECLESAHGTKYVLGGVIETPCGKTQWYELSGLLIAVETVRASSRRIRPNLEGTL